MSTERTAHLLVFKNDRLARKLPLHEDRGVERRRPLGRYARMHLVTADSVRTYDLPGEPNLIKRWWTKMKRVFGIGQSGPVLYGASIRRS